MRWKLMANNNLVLTIVLVAAALLLFNGGLSGNAVVSRSCSLEGATHCVYGNVYECVNGALVLKDQCDSKEQCNTLQTGQNVVASFCSTQQSGSSMPESFSNQRYA